MLRNLFKNVVQCQSGFTIDIRRTKTQSVLIFKHSTRCSISRFALKNFENEYVFSEEELQPYFLDLLEYRNISNEIAKKGDYFD